MSIALINASPKTSRSSSGVLLNRLFTMLPVNELTVFERHDSKMDNSIIELLDSSETWVFFFPLYVDALPSHLLAVLETLEKLPIVQNKHRIYAVVNNGFYEASQCGNAIRIMRNWCSRCGYSWGMGAGFGGCGGLANLDMTPKRSDTMRPFTDVLSEMAESIKSRTRAEDKYVSIALPRFMYKLGAEAGWKRMIKANGGRKRDLKAIPHDYECGIAQSDFSSDSTK